MIQRPYILGLNNPQGNAPLSTEPPGCAGYRLWRMVNEVCGISPQDWCAATQRVNLLSDRVLPRDYRAAAARRGDYLAPMIADRTVVLLGYDVAQSLGHELMPLAWARDRDWVMIPYPSGKNTWYNNPIHRLSVGILITDILRGFGWLDHRKSLLEQGHTY